MLLLNEGRGMDSADGRRGSASLAVFSGSAFLSLVAAVAAAGSLSSASRVRSRALSWSRSTCAFTAFKRCLDCRRDCIVAYRGVILSLPIRRFRKTFGIGVARLSILHLGIDYRAGSGEPLYLGDAVSNSGLGAVSQTEQTRRRSGGRLFAGIFLRYRLIIMYNY